MPICTIPTPEYSMADLQWIGVRCFTTVRTGAYTRSANGKFTPVMCAYEYVNTVGAGQVEISEWFRLYEAAVVREGKTADLNEQIKVARGCSWLHTEKAIHEYALERLERWMSREGQAHGKIDTT